MALLFAWLVSAAAAQTSGDVDARYERAFALVDEGKLAEARDEFERLLADAPSPAAAYNLGVTRCDTGQVLAGIEVLEAALDGRYGSLSAEEERGIRDAVAAGRSALARVRVRASGMPHVEVRVNGRIAGTVAGGEELSIEVDPGAHVVSGAAPGARDVETSVTVAAGAEAVAALELVRTRVPGRLVVHASDELIVVRGVGRGRGRFERELAPGWYEVVLPANDRTERIFVGEGHAVEIDLDADDGGVLSEPWFWIAGGALVAGAAVLVLVLAWPSDVPDHNAFGRVNALGASF